MNRRSWFKSLGFLLGCFFAGRGVGATALDCLGEPPIPDGMFAITIQGKTAILHRRHLPAFARALKAALQSDSPPEWPGKSEPSP